MRADDPLGVRGVPGNLADHDARGAGGDNGVVAALGLDARQDGALELQILRAVLQNEVGPLHGGAHDGCVHRQALKLRALCGGDGTVFLKEGKALGNQPLGTVQRLGRGVVQGYFPHAVDEQMGGPARANEARADDTDVVILIVFHG